MYKLYTVKLTNGNEIPLIAKHNREAMQLAGKLSKWYGGIKTLTNEKGELIIENES